MVNCCICGRKISVFEDKLELEQGKECCYQCAPLIRNIEKAEDSTLFFAKVSELSKKMNAAHTPYEIRQLVETKNNDIACQKGFQDNKDDLSCPVCGLALDKATEICPKCGATIDNISDNISYTEIASIYNKRLEQINKNPMYEYKVETISDSAVLGKFPKEQLQTLLRNYAITGWRLHSAFTNEIGKNAVLGINSTINETILIFERCIKAEEK